MTALELFNALQGNWILERTIEPGGKMTGEANFTPEENTVLAYVEKGRLVTDGGHETDATRHYAYYVIDHTTIEVRFADGPDSGKVFHQFHCSATDQSEAEHLCGQDTYKTRYDFSGLPGTVVIVHTVKGPNKDYVSKTTLSRAPKV